MFVHACCYLHDMFFSFSLSLCCFFSIISFLSSFLQFGNRKSRNGRGSILKYTNTGKWTAQHLDNFCLFVSDVHQGYWKVIRIGWTSKPPGIPKSIGCWWDMMISWICGYPLLGNPQIRPCACIISHAKGNVEFTVCTPWTEVIVNHQIMKQPSWLLDHRL